MDRPIVIGVPHAEDFLLRQLATEADDAAYFAAVDFSRGHLSEFNAETVSTYQNVSDVTEARINPENPNKLRLGMWQGKDFVGSINLTPDGDGNAEIGYWLDERYTGRGFATLAVRALTIYASPQFTRLIAKVDPENFASQRVLDRAGFTETSENLGRLIFEKLGYTFPDYKAREVQKVKGKEAALKPTQALEQYAELPSRRQALMAKNKKDNIVFLSHTISKKLQRCLCCSGLIDIGMAHVLYQVVNMSRKFPYHHVESDCAQEVLIPNLKEIKVIDSNEADTKIVNARKRKHRNRKRQNERKRGKS